MPSNRSMFILLAILGFAVTVNSKHGGLPDAIKMITVRGSGENDALIEWNGFEVNTRLYTIELVGVHDGKSITKIVEKDLDPFRSDYYGFVKGLEPNETYIVRVFSFNERGQSSPSPDIIFSLKDSSWPKGISDSNLRPRSPQRPIVEPMLGKKSREKNRVKVTWTPEWYDLIESGILRGNWSSPIEFIIRYGDNKNTSLWKTQETNNTWIILDDLKENTHYSAYVLAKRDNLTSLAPLLFPISLNEDWTGLPEPVITIESAFDKEVFTPGDPLTIKCSIPPNSNMLHIDIELTIGERDEFLSVSNHHSSRSVTLYTAANENVDTAKCKLSVRKTFTGDVSRSSYRSWKVEKPLNDEYLQRRYEEVQADEAFMSFRKA